MRIILIILTAIMLISCGGTQYKPRTYRIMYADSTSVSFVMYGAKPSFVKQIANQHCSRSRKVAELEMAYADVLSFYCVDAPPVKQPEEAPCLRLDGCPYKMYRLL